MSKPSSMEQVDLVKIVVDFVVKMIPTFTSSEIQWVRALKSAKVAIFNVQCKSIPIATNVKSVFAGLVKQTNRPKFIGQVCLIIYLTFVSEKVSLCFLALKLVISSFALISLAKEQSSFIFRTENVLCNHYSISYID